VDFLSALQLGLLALSSLFFLVDPIATVPVFLYMTSDSEQKERCRMARSAALTCFFVLSGFSVAGALLFRLLGITLPAFQTAGGIILLLVGLDMVQARRSGTKEVPGEAEEATVKSDAGIVPLGMPMLAGPGAISNVVVLVGQAAHWWETVTVYAAIALNRGVGGVNPAAVELAMDTGAKLVWLPTLDASNHARAFGGAGTYGFKAMTLDFKRPSTFDQTYSVLNANGKLTAETKEVIDIVHAYEAILATGHLSKAEILAVADYALSRGLKRLLITHPEYTVPDLDLDTMIDLGKRGVYMEFCAANVFPIIAKMTLVQMKEIIEAVGPEHAIISSDAGQPFHPSPPEMLRSYVQGLHEKGLSEQAIRTMCIDNPRFLLNLPLSNNPPSPAR